MSEAKVNGSAENGGDAHNDSVDDTQHDPQFVPIVYLPEVHIPTMEEHEDEMIKLRAKLYRFDNSCDPPEWKERGTGEIKMLKHRQRASVRIVMRRDKTLKICANHFVGSWMDLKPNCGSERAWVWSVNADYADEEAKPELLAARFASPDDAKKWFSAFEEAKEIVKKDGIKPPSDYSDAEEDSDAESDSGLGSEKKTESKSEENKPDEEKEESKSEEADAKTSELADQLSKVSVNTSEESK